MSYKISLLLKFQSEMQEPVCFMLGDLLCPCETVKSLSWSALQLLIQRMGILEGSPRESTVWLSTFQESFVGRDEVSKEVNHLIFESMSRAFTSCSTYLDLIARSEEEAAKIQTSYDGCSTSILDGAALQELFEGNQIWFPNPFLFFKFSNLLK